MNNHTQRVIFLLVCICTLAFCDYGEQDLVRQSRALRRQLRGLRPQGPRRPLYPLEKRSNEGALRIPSFQSNEEDPRSQQAFRNQQRQDAVRYDDYGNRQRYANLQQAERRNEQRPAYPQPPQERPVARPVYKYQKPSEPEFRQQPQPQQPLRLPSQKLNPENNSDFKRKLDRVVEVQTPRVPIEDDLYSPASGPAFAESNLSPTFSAAGSPLEQRDLEAAVASGANAFGTPENGVYQTEDRLSFQIHGQQGPHSYKYGYDTGHGLNRQFRYEERDGQGHVVGRYGFYDKYGKLQVVNYSADPLTGFHAEGAGVPEYPH